MEFMGFTFNNGTLEKYEGNNSQITIPKLVKKVNLGVFKDCQKIESITFPKGIQSIVVDINTFADMSFLSDTALNFLSFEDYMSVDWGFYDPRSSCKLCINGNPITEATIPEGIEEISATFAGCKELTVVHLPSSLKKIGKDTFSLCKSLGSIEIPNSVTEIGESAFYACESLEEIVIPDNVIEIRKEAFNVCKNLRTIKLPEKLKTIRFRTFSYCKKLETITIPSAVTRIEKYAFNSCESLKMVDLSLVENLEEIGENAFAGCKQLRFSIENGLKTKKKLSLELLKCPFQCDVEELAYIALYQGDKNWKKWVRNHASEAGIDDFFSSLVALLEAEEKPTATLLSRAEEYLSSLGNLASSESKMRLEKVLESKNGKQSKTNDSSKEDKSSTSSDIIGIFSSMMKPEKLLSWAEKKGIESKALEEVKMVGTTRKAPKEAILFIMYSYMNQMTKLPAYHASSYKTDIQPLLFSEKADSIAKMLDRKSLLKALVSVSPSIVLELYDYDEEEVKNYEVNISLGKAFKDDIYETQNKFDIWNITVDGKIHEKHFESIIPYCRYAGSAEIETFITTIENITNGWDRVGRKWSVAFRSALLLSDTKEAFSYLDKHGQADLYARMRGKTKNDILNMITSNIGLDYDGTLGFEL